jgi:hypothetical protein
MPTQNRGGLEEEKRALPALCETCPERDGHFLWL